MFTHRKCQVLVCSIFHIDIFNVNHTVFIYQITVGTIGTLRFDTVYCSVALDANHVMRA